MKRLAKLLILVLTIAVMFGVSVMGQGYSSYPVERKEPVSFTPEELAKMTAADFQAIAEEIGPETLIGKKDEGKGLRIVFSQRGLGGSEWWENLVRMAEEEAKWLGVDITIIDAQRREEKQIADLLSLLQTKPDALIINPQHPTALLKALERYQQQGIPIFVVNSDIDPRANPVSFVSGDGFQMGYNLGWALAEAANQKGLKGEIKGMILSGFPGELVSLVRRQGIMAGFNEYQFQHNGKSHLNIVSQQFANWLPENAMKITQDVLSAHPDLDIVFCEDDGTAQGAIAALEMAGKLNTIIGGSIDGRKQILKSVSEGKWNVDVMQDPRHQGKWVVYFAVQHLLGNKVPSTFYIPTPAADQKTVQKYYNPASQY